MKKKKAPVEFVDTDLKDSFGVNKIAVFESKGPRILIERNSWEKLNAPDKYALVALEIFGLIGLKDRYLVDALIKENFEQIAGLSSDANAPTMTKAGEVFSGLIKMEADSPHFYLGKRSVGLGDFRYGGTTSVKLENYQLFHYETSRYKQFEMNANGLRMLPYDYLLDLIIIGEASFNQSTIGRVGYSTYTFSFDLPHEYVVRDLKAYADGLIQVASSNATSPLGQAGWKEIQRQARAMSKILTLYSKNKDAFGNWVASYDMNDPGKKIFSILIKDIKSKVHFMECRIPGTFSGDYEARVLLSLDERKSATEHEIDFSRQEFAQNMSQLESNIENIETAIDELPGPRESDSQVAAIMALTRTSAFALGELKSQTEMDIRLLSDLSFKISDGSVCKKSKYINLQN